MLPFPLMIPLGMEMFDIFAEGAPQGALTEENHLGMNKAGKGRFRGYSAGSQPKGRVNAHTLTLLQGLAYDTAGFRSKSWDEFAKLGAPAFDFVFTVCDSAAAEACPVWQGLSSRMQHWSCLGAF